MTTSHTFSTPFSLLWMKLRSYLSHVADLPKPTVQPQKAPRSSAFFRSAAAVPRGEEEDAAGAGPLRARAGHRTRWW